MHSLTGILIELFVSVRKAARVDEESVGEKRSVFIVHLGTRRVQGATSFSFTELIYLMSLHEKV